MIPKEKLDTVFQLAIKECRARTLAHVTLPPNESCAVENVTNKPWGGYNWYKGNFQSVIQVNTDLPIFIDRAVDLAAHEGIPAITFTIRCWKRTWSAIVAGWSFRFTLSSHRNRSSPKARRISAGTLRSRLRPSKSSSKGKFCFRRPGSFQARRRILCRTGFDEGSRYAGNEAARRLITVRSTKTPRCNGCKNMQ